MAKATGKKAAREEMLEARKNFDEQKRKRHKIVVEALNEVAATDSGKLVLNHIMHTCGAKLSSVVLVDGVVDINAVTFNEGRRSVWLNLEGLVLSRHLKKIEFMKG